MSNQVQRPGVHVPYDPDAIFYPNGTRKMHSCDYWARGQCRYTAAVCNNAHSWLEFVPIGNRPVEPHRPAPIHPNYQNNHRMHAQAAHLNSPDPHARYPAPASGPVYSTSDSTRPLGPAPVHRGQLGHIAGMSLLETALRNSNQGRAALTTGNLAMERLHQQVYGAAMPAVSQARGHSIQPTSRLPLPPGSPFNPAAPIFRSALQPNREAEYRNKNEKLLRTLDEQTAVIVAVQEELFNTASDIFCAIKDIKDVAKSLQQGQGNEVTNMKKLAYRATDLETVLERQENWRRRLAELSMPDVSRA